MNHNDYLFSNADGFKFLRRFDDMYRNCADPHGQSKELQRIDYQILAVLLDKVISVPGRPTPRVLDVGCGLGYFTAHVRDLFPNAEVAGCDVSATAVEKARAHAPRCSFFTADLKDGATLPTGAYDVLVALHVLCYFTAEEINGVVRNLSRLLVPGGFVLVAHHLPKKMSFARYMMSLGDARELFEANGFKMRFELDITNELDVTYAGDAVGRNILFLAQNKAE